MTQLAIIEKDDQGNLKVVQNIQDEITFEQYNALISDFERAYLENQILKNDLKVVSMNAVLSLTSQGIFTENGVHPALGSEEAVFVTILRSVKNGVSKLRKYQADYVKFKELVSKKAQLKQLNDEFVSQLNQDQFSLWQTLLEEKYQRKGKKYIWDNSLLLTMVSGVVSVIDSVISLVVKSDKDVPELNLNLAKLTDDALSVGEIMKKWANHFGAEIGYDKIINIITEKVEFTPEELEASQQRVSECLDKINQLNILPDKILNSVNK